MPNSGFQATAVGRLDDLLNTAMDQYKLERQKYNPAVDSFSQQRIHLQTPHTVGLGEALSDPSARRAAIVPRRTENTGTRTGGIDRLAQFFSTIKGAGQANSDANVKAANARQVQEAKFNNQAAQAEFNAKLPRQNLQPILNGLASFGGSGSKNNRLDVFKLIQKADNDFAQFSKALDAANIDPAQKELARQQIQQDRVKFAQQINANFPGVNYNPTSVIKAPHGVRGFFTNGTVTQKDIPSVPPEFQSGMQELVVRGGDLAKLQNAPDLSPAAQKALVYVMEQNIPQAQPSHSIPKANPFPSHYTSTSNPALAKQLGQ